MNDARGAEHPAPRILEEGSTCWRLAHADRIAVLIDGAAYFAALLEALRAARHRIVIVGWDFDSRVRLDPADPDTEPRRLLPALVAAQPSLQIHLLIWDTSLVFGPSRMTGPLADRGWASHPRVHYRLDGHHPFVASNHEKIVCVDDSLAFAGGIDLTINRWDTSAHVADDPLRASSDGEVCPPVHDLQMAVSGEAARALAALTRGRWAEAGGDELAPCDAAATLWPASAPPWLENVQIGIARTRAGTRAVAEVAQLNAAALAAARRCVYIEAQYFSAAPIVDRLGRDAAA